MSIKLVCTTTVNGELIARPILDKSTTPANIIAIADRFLSLNRELAIMNGESFVGLTCEVDGKPVAMRSLVESVSTVHHLLRRKLYGPNGFTVLKHEVEARAFLQRLDAPGQPLPAPLWTGQFGGVAPAPKGRKRPPSPTAALPADDQDLLNALSAQTEERVEPAKLEAPAAKKESRRMNTSNLKL